MLIVLGLMNLTGVLQRVTETLTPPAGPPDTVHAHPHPHGDYVHTHVHGHQPEAHPHAARRRPRSPASTGGWGGSGCTRRCVR